MPISLTLVVQAPPGWRLYPELPGLEFPVVKTSRFHVIEKKTASGRSVRQTYWTWPIWEYSLSYEFLRERQGLDEFQQLLAFFNGGYGRLTPFLFRDDSDFSKTDAVFGVGDGVTVDFSLTRTVGGVSEPVGAAIITNLKIAGSISTAYTLLNDRLVRFSTPPALGAQLRWSGYYWLRCIFSDEAISGEEFLSKIWKSKAVKIETVKP